MSAQGGIWNVSGYAIEPPVRNALRRGLCGAGVDRFSEHVGKGIVIANGVLRTTEEPLNSLCATAASTGAVLTWDGRLDNADELARRLDVRRDETAGTPALVLQAYLRWGPESFRDLVGDWALAVWDPTIHTLVLARDFFGTKPLYFRISGDTVVWSSNLRTFLMLDGSIPALDDSYLVGFITGYADPSITPYRGIRAVPSGHAVGYDGQSTRTSRLWCPRPGQQIVYENEAEYDAHFRSLFDDAVRVRLKSAHPICLELSGGLDSSSIVCVAAKLQEERTRCLATATYVFSASRSADERQYSDMVEAGCGLPWLHLDEQEFSLFFCESGAVPAERPRPAAGRVAALAARMDEIGARVLLSGCGGDAVMWSSPDPRLDLREHLSQLRLGQFVRVLTQYHRQENISLWNLLWNDLCRPSTGRETRIATMLDSNPWLVLRHAVKHSDGQKQEDPRTFDAPYASRPYWQVLRETVEIVAANDFRNTSQGIEARYPYLDRPLVEFMLAVPATQKRRPERNRVLHRRALWDVLPRMVAARSTKAGAAEPVSRALAREWERVRALFAGVPLVIEREIVGVGFLEILDRARLGWSQPMFPLVRIIALEAWFQDLKQWLRCPGPVPSDFVVEEAV